MFVDQLPEFGLSVLGLLLIRAKVHLERFNRDLVEYSPVSSWWTRRTTVWCTVWGRRAIGTPVSVSLCCWAALSSRNHQSRCWKVTEEFEKLRESKGFRCWVRKLRNLGEFKRIDWWMASSSYKLDEITRKFVVYDV